MTTYQYFKLLALLSPTTYKNYGNEHQANFAGKCTLLDDPWIIDSGVSDHMVGNIRRLNNIKITSSYPLVKILDGSVLRVTHIGTSDLTPKI